MSIGGDVNATVMTSVAFQESLLSDIQYPTIEIQLNREAFDRQLTVLVKGQAWDFGHPDTMVQEFTGYLELHSFSVIFRYVCAVQLQSSPMSSSTNLLISAHTNMLWECLLSLL